MTERRRHRLIWAAVAGVHFAALGAVWLGGAAGVSEPAREGGLILVSLVSEPVALPGEAKGGVALGAGLPVPVALAAAPVLPSSSSVAPAAASSPAASAVRAEVPAVVPAPVAEVFVPPAFRVRQEPAYPERARRAGVEGVVGVRISLSPEGAVLAVELTRASGSRLLDEAALAAARASSFVPASRNRLPVAAEADASYRFELR